MLAYCIYVNSQLTWNTCGQKSNLYQVFSTSVLAQVFQTNYWGWCFNYIRLERLFIAMRSVYHFQAHSLITASTLECTVYGLMIAGGRDCVWVLVSRVCILSEIRYATGCQLLPCCHGSPHFRHSSQESPAASCKPTDSLEKTIPLSIDWHSLHNSTSMALFNRNWRNGYIHENSTQHLLAPQAHNPFFPSD